MDDIGGIKELTSADYNYPANNPDGVALWKLPIGWYAISSSLNPIKVYPSIDGNSENAYGGLFSITQIQNKVFIGKWINDLGDFKAAFRRTDTTGSAIDMSWNGFYLLGNTSIVNDLTTSSSSKVLSAAQGKALKDFIGDLTNLTTTDKTNLVAAINEAAISGGAKELTSDMVNYPDNNPTDIALWKLEPGFYYRTGFQMPIIRSSTNHQVNNCIGVLICKASGKTYMYCLPGYGTTSIECYATQTSTGIAQAEYGGSSVGTLAYNYMLAPKTGSGAPTTATSASIGKVYIDTDTDTAYMCTKASGGEYTWKQITA